MIDPQQVQRGRVEVVRVHSLVGDLESEVVAGYAVEYSGPMLMMFLLAEYLHLVISSVHFVIFFCGG